MTVASVGRSPAAPGPPAEGQAEDRKGCALGARFAACVICGGQAPPDSSSTSEKSHTGPALFVGKWGAIDLTDLLGGGREVHGRICALAPRAHGGGPLRAVSVKCSP